MTKAEFKKRLNALGISCWDFAKYIGVWNTTLSKWEEVPLYAVRVIELLEEVQGERSATKIVKS